MQDEQLKLEAAARKEAVAVEEDLLRAKEDLVAAEQERDDALTTLINVTPASVTQACGRCTLALTLALALTLRVCQRGILSLSLPVPVRPVVCASDDLSCYYYYFL